MLREQDLAAKKTRSFISLIVCSLLPRKLIICFFVDFCESFVDEQFSLLLGEINKTLRKKLVWFTFKWRCINACIVGRMYLRLFLSRLHTRELQSEGKQRRVSSREQPVNELLAMNSSSISSLCFNQKAFLGARHLINRAESCAADLRSSAMNHDSANPLSNYFANSTVACT